MQMRAMIFRWLPVLLIASQAGVSSAEIYRCEHGDVVEFSDRPCQENASAHQPRRQISIITPATDLEETARRNRAFLEQRRERLEASRDEDPAEDASADREDEPSSGYREQDTLYVPYSTEPSPRGRERARRQRPEERESGDDDRVRFSPLTGRLPGARRSEDDD